MLAQVYLAPGPIKALRCFLSGLSLARAQDVAESVRDGGGQGKVGAGEG